MPDQLKIVDFNAGGRPIELFDLERIDSSGNSGDVLKERDTFKYTPADAQSSEAGGVRRWDGSRVVGQRFGNAQVGAKWWVRGATAQAALDNMALFLEFIRNANVPGRYLSWKPAGATYPIYYEIRGPGTWTPDYSAIRFEQVYSIAVDGSWPVAPLAEMDRMDIGDDFSSDSVADYTYDSGTRGDVTVNPTTGVLTPFPSIAGVGGIEMWLKPETLGTNGSAISSWHDSSLSGNFPTQPNLIPTNPSFESGTTGWVLNNTGSFFTSPTFTTDNTWWSPDFGYGQKFTSAKFSGTKDNTATVRTLGIRTSGTGTSGIPVTAGLTYYFRADVNIFDAPNAAGDARLRINVTWYTGAGATISQSQVDERFDPAATIHNLSGSVPAVATAAFMNVEVQIVTDVALDGININIDNVIASLSDAPTVVTNVLDGNKVARFNGTTQCLAVAGITANDPSRTVIIVAKADTGASLTAWSFDDAVRLIVTSSEWRWFYSQAVTQVTLGTAPTSWSCVALRFNSTNNVPADYVINGGSQGSFDPHDNYSLFPTSQLFVGGRNSGGSGDALFDGDIAEMIVFNSNLSDADFAKVRGYLSTKYPSLGSFGTKPALANGTSLAVTTERRARHTARGYQYLDHQATAKFTPGPWITGFKGGLTLRAFANTYLEAYVDDNGTNSRLRIDYVIAGVRTNLGSTNLAARIVDSVPYWIRVRFEGGQIRTDYFVSAPTPLGTADSTVGPSSLGAALTTFFVAGHGGYTWIPQSVTATMDDYEDLPLSYRAVDVPRLVALNVPGDDSAPAKIGLDIETSGGTGPVWGLFAWWKEATWNRIWNGDFEVDTSGWSLVGVGTGSGPSHGSASNIQAFPIASLANPRFGASSAQLSVTVTIGSGVHFRAYGFYRKGLTYTFEIWLRQTSGTNNIRLKTGTNSSPGESGNTVDTTCTPTWQKASATWIPTQDYLYADMVLTTETAAANNIQIDGAAIYEGTVAPTLATQTEGRGAAPAAGIIEAEGACSLTTWAVVGDSNFRDDLGIRVTTSGAGTAQAEWFIDPSAIDLPAFSRGEMDIEVWARVELVSTLVSPQLWISVGPESGASWGTQRYSAEYGSLAQIGKVPALPSSGTVYRPIRLGTVTVFSNPDQPARWKLRLNAAWAVGSSGAFGIDQLILVPMERRAITGPTARAAVVADYPFFVPNNSPTNRRFETDGSGWIAKPNQGMFPGAGLSAPIEMEPGANQLLCWLSSLVPDDPTVNTTSEAETHSIFVHVRVTPRAHLARGS